ncbi:hypothetical protein K3495_g11296 [Podosphaera aphanis]|nr:hypothetical protein K3495_g11296 [Podosphaera aphanis]
MKHTLLNPMIFSWAWLSTLTVPILAHTWVESVNLIASDGSFKQTGYARAFGGRIPGVNPDKENTYLLPPNGRAEGTQILPTDLMCKESQKTQKQSPGFPRLSAAPEDRISLAYHENGHVTMFTTTDGKPAGRGTVFIYGTKKPSPTDTYLGIHRMWNADGSGGDKRGKLLASRPFDDGQCYQNNNEKISQDRAKALGFSNVKEAPEILCQSALQLPQDAGVTGTYTLYWVWEWPTLDRAGNIFKNESYTSCIDIDMTAKPIAQVYDLKEVSKADANSAAVKGQLQSNQFIVDPTAPASKASDNPFTQAGSAPVPANNKPKTTSTGIASSQTASQIFQEVSVSIVTVTTTEKPAAVTTTVIVQSTPSNKIQQITKAMRFRTDATHHSSFPAATHAIRQRAMRVPRRGYST